MLEKIVSVLEVNNADPKVDSKTKSLKPILYNVYKDARQSSR